MVWHNVSIGALVDGIGRQTGGSQACVLWEPADGLVMYVVTPRLLAEVAVTADAPASAALPPLSTLMWERHPTIAAIFCAESASVYGTLRLPVVTRQNAEDILVWAKAIGLAVDPARGPLLRSGALGSDTAEECRAVRDPRGRRRVEAAAAATRSSSEGGGGGGAGAGAGNKRRRGVRKWVVTSVDAVRDRSGGTPVVVYQLVEWLLRVLRQSDVPPEPWQLLPVEQLVEAAVAVLAEDAAPAGHVVFLRSLLTEHGPVGGGGGQTRSGRTRNQMLLVGLEPTTSG